MPVETMSFQASDGKTSGCPLHAFRGSEHAVGGMGARLAIMLYGLLGYAMFFVTILYAIGFVGNWFVPKSIDSGSAGPLVPSLAVNAAILAAFVVQHMIMARPWFKRWFTRFVPAPMERSTFVIAASAILMILFWQWRPAPEVVWEISHPAARWALIVLSLLGWVTVFYASFLINHFDLFGLRQVFCNLLNLKPKQSEFQVASLYKIVRHPLMVGFLVAFWSTPTMTVGHLFFAAMTTAYIIVGVRLEERDLEAEFGERYRQYKRSVRALVPLPKLR